MPIEPKHLTIEETKKWEQKRVKQIVKEMDREHLEKAYLELRKHYCKAMKPPEYVEPKKRRSMNGT